MGDKTWVLKMSEDFCLMDGSPVVGGRSGRPIVQTTLEFIQLNAGHVYSGISPDHHLLSICKNSVLIQVAFHMRASTPKSVLSCHFQWKWHDCIDFRGGEHDKVESKSDVCAKKKRSSTQKEAYLIFMPFNLLPFGLKFLKLLGLRFSKLQPDPKSIHYTSRKVASKKSQKLFFRIEKFRNSKMFEKSLKSLRNRKKRKKRKIRHFGNILFSYGFQWFLDFFEFRKF